MILFCRSGIYSGDSVKVYSEGPAHTNLWPASSSNTSNSHIENALKVNPCFTNSALFIAVPFLPNVMLIISAEPFPSTWRLLSIFQARSLWIVSVKPPSWPRFP